MRVTIIKDDNAVIVDGVARSIDCSGLPATFHALQWDGVRGEIEYAATRCDHCGVRSKKPNETLLSMDPYVRYVETWRTEDARIRAEEAAAKAEHDRRVQAAQGGG